MDRIDTVAQAMQLTAARLAMALVNYSIEHDDDTTEAWMDMAHQVGAVAAKLGVVA